MSYSANDRTVHHEFRTANDVEEKYQLGTDLLWKDASVFEQYFGGRLEELGGVWQSKQMPNGEVMEGWRTAMVYICLRQATISGPLLHSHRHELQGEGGSHWQLWNRRKPR